MRPNALILLIVICSLSLRVDAKKDTIRSIDSKHHYFTLYAAPTFHPRVEEISGDYLGIRAQPGIGFDGGLGFLFPIFMGQNGTHYHYSTFLSGGVTPIWFKATLDDDDFRNPNTLVYKARLQEYDLSFRQSFYRYTRRSHNKIRSLGIGINAKIKSFGKNEFVGEGRSEIIFQDVPTDTEIRFFEERSEGFRVTRGFLELQVSRGWQRLTKNNVMYGIEAYYSYTLGTPFSYNYSADSPTFHIEGQLQPRRSLIGIRFTLAITKFGVSQEGLQDRFPN